MADRRKLQGEIERCLKKVSEGVETFEDIWQKVHNATNSNQKEKYEADLKKEIKKLQRLRDQIKTWVASSDIKDKRMLVENRKLIETQMERFKVVERETKTKAYSKEGLGAAQKLDPAQREKDEITNWLASSIESLNIQMDQFESEIESLMVGLKKKKNDKEKQERIEELKAWLEKHRYHIKQLETLMRMLDNSTVEVDQIKKIKDDVEYYIESSQEPDFEENEFIYDDLDLEDMQEFLAKSYTQYDLETGNMGGDDESSTAHSNTPTSTNSSSPAPSPGLTNHSKTNEDQSGQPVKPVPIRAHSSSSSTSGTTQSPKAAPPSSRNNSSSTQSSSSSSPSLNSHNNHSVISPTPPTTPYAVAAAASQNSNLNKTIAEEMHTSLYQVWERADFSLSGTTKEACHWEVYPENNNKTNSIDAVSMNSSIPINSSHSSSSSTSVSTSFSTMLMSQTPVSTVFSQIQPLSCVYSLTTTNSNQSLAANTDNVLSSSTTGPTSGTTLYSAAASASVQLSVLSVSTNNPSVPSSGPQSSSNTLLMNGPVTSKIQPEESMSSLKSMAQQAVLNAGLENRLPPSQSLPSSDGGLYENNSSSLSLQGKVVQPPSVTPTTLTTEAHIPPLLGVAPLGPVPLTKECLYQLRMVESSARHMPHPSDSERFRPYLPRNLCPVPPYYPQGLPHCDAVEFFQRLSTETLFFIFYYMEGTKAQYLSAKALKKQSWRFHTKYMMWFQRHEEPKTITDEYEQGTYIYFDYEKWGQRKKEGFTFEYRYLEDRDLN